ncbi:hypothetical protein C0584_00575 [Candidatus Parcubacteria bacterium]|nr:MAG: hypothetical protein C0584_00575 [Candidatus Parcubacteria bacterium]
MKKILVIGCGGAGMFSSIVATQLRPGKFRATILSDEEDIYCRCTSPYIIKKEAKLKDAIQPESMIADFGVEVVHEKAISIDTAKKVVITNKNNFFVYDYLVIGTGSSPFVPQIPGLTKTNHHTVRQSKDIYNIENSIKGKKKAVIIGAGVIGIEMASALRERKMDVIILEKAEKISSYMAELEYSTKILNHLRDSHINVLFNTEIKEIESVRDKKVINIKRNGEKEKIETDIIIIATGVKANKKIAEDAGITCGRSGIIVDEKMRTNVKNVYACGDCVMPVSAITGENTVSQLASTAIHQSKIVGYQIAGFPIKYQGTTNAFAFKFLGRDYGQVGLNETEAKKKFKIVVTGSAESTNIYQDLDAKKPLNFKLVFAGPKLRLVGAMGYGNGITGFLEVSSMAIGLKMSILKVMKYNYIAHPSLTPWPFMNPIVMASEDAMGKVMNFFKRKK